MIKQVQHRLDVRAELLDSTRFDLLDARPHVDKRLLDFLAFRFEVVVFVESFLNFFDLLDGVFEIAIETTDLELDLISRAVLFENFLELLALERFDFCLEPLELLRQLLVIVD